jgi:hypothetical protein
VDAQQQGSAFAQGRRVVADARAVRGADFDKLAAALAHHVGNTEAAADLYQLAA